MIQSNLQFIFTKFIPKTIELVLIKKFGIPLLSENVGVPVLTSLIRLELEGDIPENVRRMLTLALAELEGVGVSENRIEMPPMWKRDP